MPSFDSSVYYPAGWPGIYPSQPQELPAADYAAGIAQIESSGGPRRVPTWRQRAALEHAPQPRRIPGHPYDGGIQVYHPLIPSSASAPSSTYGFYHSCGNSLANSTSPRYASPALSTASAFTSVSSWTSAPDSFALFAPPPVPTERVEQKGIVRGVSLRKPNHRLSYVDRKALCIYHKENPNARQVDIARLYGVERSTISKILKNKTKWLNIPADVTSDSPNRPFEFAEIEENMVKWLLQCRDNDTILSDSMIGSKAKEIAPDFGVVEERFRASHDWIENFKHRHGVRAERALGLGPHADNETPLLSPLRTRFSQRNDDLPEPSPEPEGVGARHMDVPCETARATPFSVPYSSSASEPTPEETTLAQADAAIDTVIHFLDTRGHGILQMHERNVLTTVKCALFQAASEQGEAPARLP
ncbi:hypothetical protein C8R43DRAFT_1179850 [Mycena crocata]|nr:hypothetical protein C8R43DRAFT_1179850 [Mycena crocata]